MKRRKRISLRPRSREHPARARMGGIFLLGLLWVCSGCGGEAPKPTKVPIQPAKPAAVAAPAKAVARPAADLKVVDPPPAVEYTYRSVGKPNPFQPLVVERVELPKKTEQAAKSLEDGTGTPLEKVELTALKLVAVVWDIPIPRALVEDGAGRGYIVAVGTRMGKNRGVVTKVNPSGLVVTEKYELDGKLKNRDVPLRLYTE